MFLMINILSLQVKIQDYKNLKIKTKIYLLNQKIGILSLQAGIET